MATLFFYQGHTYEIVVTAMTWANAQSNAVLHSAHLATVSSAGENNIIFQNAAQSVAASLAPTAPDGGDAAYLWLGASDKSQEGSWRWIDGAAVSSYSNWGSGVFGAEPDNYQGIQHAMALGLEVWPRPSGGYGTAGTWNDISEHNLLYSVIEWDYVTDTTADNTPPTGAVQITGSLVQGQTLSAVTTALSDAGGLGSFSYQWLRAGSAVNGATQGSYTLVQADVGQTMTVRVSYTDGLRSEE